MPSLKAIAKVSKNKAAPPKKVVKKSTIQSALSSEFVGESDEDKDNISEEDSSSEDEPAPNLSATTLPKVNGKKPAPAVLAPESSSSGSESPSDDEAGSEQGDSEESEESEGDEGGNSSASGSSTSSGAQAGRSTPKTHAVIEKPPPYQPPFGFESKSIESTPQASELFEKSNLDGKQIWYITAPASVDISTIKEMTLSAANQREPVICQDDNDYSFVQDTLKETGYATVLIPNDSNDTYHAVSQPIDRIFHLQKIISLPGALENAISTSKSAVATVPHKRPPRPQPSGLKMRYLPIGFGSGEAGRIGSSSPSTDQNDSHDEMTDAPRSFPKPPSISPSPEPIRISSDSSDDDSDSNVVMDDPWPIPSKQKKFGSSQTLPSSSAGSSLKRKHSERSKNKANNSSSRSDTQTDDKELKRPKEKEKLSQKSAADTQSALFETPRSAKKARDITQASSQPIVPTKSAKSSKSKSASILPPSLTSTPKGKLKYMPTTLPRSTPSKR